jgi:hypothetical protein
MANLVDLVAPLLLSVPGIKKIILPPQPRYLFSGCCDNKSHCTNINNGDHADGLLTETIRMRSVLKRSLAQKLPMGEFWVTDSCCAIEKVGTLTTAERISKLKPLLCKDGVHLEPRGYLNMAENLVGYVEGLTQGSLGKTQPKQNTAASIVAGTGQRFCWHGFSSPVGLKLPQSQPHHSKQYRERQRSFLTPYSRGGELEGRKVGWEKKILEKL